MLCSVCSLRALVYNCLSFKLSDADHSSHIIITCLLRAPQAPPVVMCVCRCVSCLRASHDLLANECQNMPFPQLLVLQTASKPEAGFLQRHCDQSQSRHLHHHKCISIATAASNCLMITCMAALYRALDVGYLVVIISVNGLGTFVINSYVWLKQALVMPFQAA